MLILNFQGQKRTAPLVSMLPMHLKYRRRHFTSRQFRTHPAIPPSCLTSLWTVVFHLEDARRSLILLLGHSLRSPHIKPWAPFRTRADFEYAESVVLSNMERKWVNVQLAGIGGEWSNSPSNITFHNYDHTEKTLSAARTYGVQFQTGEVEAEFEGVPYKFEFQYRDPWKWIVDLLSDPTLADKIHWYPVQKFLVKDGIEVRLFDEPYTGNKSWKIQEILPHVPGLPHCFIPIALWLDKGMVTKPVRKHPIVLRALFLDGKIRNASGNGGGVLIGYMVIPLDPGDPSDRKHASKAVD
ncbi:hypothetical protein B0H14DRAFT_2529625 [Mycena olivaceomarginata]|nr:hypothetical protein B0H14DRAFT_2529625 [Mycena olivaceomarginata]